MISLRKKYGNKTAVDGLNVTLTDGVYGLLGANGAGKTTLMRMLCGLLKPSGGEIRFNGQEIGKMGGEYRRVLGYLPQDFGYYPDFSADRYLQYLAELKAIPPRLVDEKIEEVLELTDLKEARKQKLKTYSGGMLRRLGIGQAVLNDPDILILDEPTSGLDPKERIRFRNIISALGKKRIVLLSTHIVQDVEFIADKIYLMKQGRLVKEGTVEQLTQTVRGKVWECLVDEAWADRLNERYPVSNIKYEAGQVRLRVVSGEKPVPDASCVEPNLEDVYLLNFAQQEGQDQ